MSGNIHCKSTSLYICLSCGVTVCTCVYMLYITRPFLFCILKKFLKTNKYVCRLHK